jgi:hypothetical protein
MIFNAVNATAKIASALNPRQGQGKAVRFFSANPRKKNTGRPLDGERRLQASGTALTEIYFLGLKKYAARKIFVKVKIFQMNISFLTF